MFAGFLWDGKLLADNDFLVEHSLLIFKFKFNLFILNLNHSPL